MTRGRWQAGLVAVNVKLVRPDAGRPPATLKRAPGVVRVTRTFPEEDDEELSTLYVLHVEPEKAKAVLRALRRDPGVAYAEESAPRKAASSLR